MIEALDRIVVAAASPQAALTDCALVLGRRAEGAAFRLANVRLEIVAAGAGGQGLAGLAFAVTDLGQARRLLERRALPLAGPPAHAEEARSALHLAPAATHGVAISLTVSAPTAPAVSPLAAAGAASAVTGLDHVVIRSPDPERAIVLYAGRLGLSLRLDRTEPAWGSRLLFFRCGDLVVEVVHDLAAGPGAGPDRLWGLSWRVEDIAAAHARLRAAGVDVSDPRAGRRPRTRVLTVRSHTAGVPTLLIGPDRAAT